MWFRPPPKPCKKLEAKDLRRPGGMKVGITAFGHPKRYKILEGICEFQSFIEENSKLKVDIWFVQESNLPAGDIPLDRNNACYMVDQDKLSPDSKGKMPSDMETNIVLYDTQDRVPMCYGGLTWGFRKPVPQISIPYNNDASWDRGWETSLAPTLVHEFTHALYALLRAQRIEGFKDLPKIDRAHDYNFTEATDPGWINFRKWCLDKITQEMADALMKE